jgi:hypothetical protein
MSTNAQEPKADGAAFDDFFESIGKKAETLTTDNKNGEPQAESAAEAVSDEPQLVDEIESLCMNCRENVSAISYRFTLSLANFPGINTPSPYPNSFLPRDYHHVLLLPTLLIQELRNPICR